MSNDVHFVLGTGRCGSSLAHEMLCRHESVEFISNLQDRFSWLDKTGSMNSRVFRSLPPSASMKGRIRFAPSEAYEAIGRDVGPLLVDPYRDLLASDATNALTSRLRRFFENPDRTVVHKFTGWPRARLLAHVFPDAKFVHVVRDPRAVVSSWLRMQWWRGHLGPDGWHFGPLDETQAKIWSDANESFAILGALGWQTVLDAAAECRVELGSAWLDVRYEDLCSDPENTLNQALDHLGISPTHAWKQQLGRYQLNRPQAASGPWPELGNDLQTLETVCARGMEFFRYQAVGS